MSLCQEKLILLTLSLNKEGEYGAIGAGYFYEDHSPSPKKSSID
jgi:hypothetical protein